MYKMSKILFDDWGAGIIYFLFKKTNMFLVATSVVVILTTIYYSVEIHPSFEGMKQYGDFDGIFRFLGMAAFSMSFAGCVIPVYNRMGNPNKYGFTIGSGEFGFSGTKSRPLSSSRK